jgi:hypothetical protein
LDTQTTGAGEVLESAANRYILHQRYVGITPERSENTTSNEDGLITGCDTGNAGTQVHHKLDQAVDWVPARKPYIESTPDGFFARHCR